MEMYMHEVGLALCMGMEMYMHEVGLALSKSLQLLEGVCTQDRAGRQRSMSRGDRDVVEDGDLKAIPITLPLLPSPEGRDSSLEAGDWLIRSNLHHWLETYAKMLRLGGGDSCRRPRTSTLSGSMPTHWLDCKLPPQKTPRSLGAMKDWIKE